MVHELGTINASVGGVPQHACHVGRTVGVFNALRHLLKLTGARGWVSSWMTRALVLPRVFG